MRLWLPLHGIPQAMKPSRKRQRVPIFTQRSLNEPNTGEKAQIVSLTMNRLLLLASLLLLYCAPSSAHRSSNTNFYSLLGISKSASSTEVKKAYRKAALKNHPDKPTGNADKFKQVQKAYEVLSDPDKRQKYDQFGEAGVDGATGNSPFAGGFGGSPFGGFGPRSQGGGYQSYSNSFYYNQQSAESIDLSDILRRMMMGGMPQDQSFHGGVGFGSPYQQRRRQPRPAPSRPVELQLQCTLEELYAGATVKRRKVNFPPQQGGPYTYEIHIGKGWKTGTKVKYPAFRNRPAVTFLVQEAIHSQYTRDGNDLRFKYVLPKKQPTRRIKRKKRVKKKTRRKKSEAIHADYIPSKKNDEDMIHLSIVLLDGETWSRDVRSDSSLVQPGKTLVVLGKGMPFKKGEEHGDLIIEFVADGES